MSAAIRVLVADDHQLVRAGIVRILLDAGRVDVVAEACDGVEAVEQAIENQPDIVITDLSMPRLSGLDAVRRIHDALPKCRILVLTALHDEEYIVPIVEAGASGYLVKDSASAELPAAIDALASGGVYFGSEATKVLAAELQRIERLSKAPQESLTDREKDVFELMLESKSDADIAALLGIGAKTARKYRSRISGKLGLQSAGGIANYAARKGPPGGPD